jgi:putative phage-type endonuclease
MKTHVLIQGSPQWHAHRSASWNASEAPAMMGCSPYKTREQLLDEMATGITEEVTPEMQRRFDDGHRFEALARPLAEKIIGEELAPVTGSSDEVIAGRALSASFDGIDFMETVAFEHKSLNHTLREAFAQMDENPAIDSGYLLPLVYRVQMEQQIMVSKAERILFMASKWDGDNLVEERHCWYYPDAQLADKIRAGWAQFAADLATHKPQVAQAKPVGKTPETLPALRIEVTGAVSASNLAEYKAHAMEVFAAIKRDPSTDQEFADAEKTVKWCGEVEERLAAALSHARAQMGDVDKLFSAVEDVQAEARRVRLDLEKIVKARKDQMRLEIVTNAGKQLADHIDALNTALGSRWLSHPAPAFGEAIKGKRTLASITEAVNVVLAEAKMAANQAAERFKANRAALVIEAHDWITLFPDFAVVGSKSVEDFDALAQLRITRHKQAEQEAADRLAKLAEAQAQAKAAPAPAPVVMAAPTPAPWVEPAAPARVAVAVPADAEPLTTGEICARLGPGLTLTVDFLKARGFTPIESKTPGTRWKASDYPYMCQALSQHVMARMNATAQALAA